MSTRMRDDDDDRDDEREGGDDRRADGRCLADAGHRSRLQVSGLDVCPGSEGSADTGRDADRKHQPAPTVRNAGERTRATHGAIVQMFGETDGVVGPHSYRTLVLA
jgi:hypothetical protein